jgi:hypothetical protein
MSVEKRWELRPAYRRRCGFSGESEELCSSMGKDIERMSPKGRAVSGAVTGV